VSTSRNPSIAYYITSHGYGHGVRSCDIIRAVNHFYPELTIEVVSELPAQFLANRIGNARNTLRSLSLDVGMVQIDSIRVDVDASLARVEKLYSRHRELVEQEAAYLRESVIDLVVADIPAIPLESAALVGIPRLAIANFSWDWIYSGFISRNARWDRLVELFREAYGRTNLLLRLPFCDSMDAFPCIEDIPLLADPGKSRRAEIAALTGCDPGKKWILLSFTTLEWDDAALGAVEKIDDYEFFTIHPLQWRRRNIYPLRREQVTFSDALASVDGVISKPGYGILSDCVVNRKPLIYADRNDFLEYPILEAALKKYLKHLHISTDDLYRGDLRGSLIGIWSRPEPAGTLPRGGAAVAAERIAHYAGVAGARGYEG
jgi:hypothetical protein